MDDRVLVFKALVGSQNYNLATPKSDKDYKAFVYPTLDDLYEGKSFKKASTSEGMDIEYHDIRKLPNLLAKSNVNFLEVLFSEEATSGDELHTQLLDLRDDIARMNLSHLFDACMGMFNKELNNYRKQMKKGDKAQAFKYAASAVRITDFLVRFSLGNFEHMKTALRYSEGSVGQKFILYVKTGRYPSYHIDYILQEHEKAAADLKKLYKSYKKNEELEVHLKELVKKHTLKNLEV